MKRLTLRELKAASEALRARLAGEIDPDETSGLTFEDYDGAQDKIDAELGKRSRKGKQK